MTENLGNEMCSTLSESGRIAHLISGKIRFQKWHLVHLSNSSTYL